MHFLSNFSPVRDSIRLMFFFVLLSSTQPSSLFVTFMLPDMSMQNTIIDSSSTDFALNLAGSIKNSTSSLVGISLSSILTWFSAKQNSHGHTLFIIWDRVETGYTIWVKFFISLYYYPIIWSSLSLWLFLSIKKIKKRKTLFSLIFDLWFLGFAWLKENLWKNFNTESSFSSH